MAVLHEGKERSVQHFKHFKNMVEKETGMQIKCLRSDGGGEYFSNEFSRFLDDEQGIKRQFTCRYTPQQNGVAERKNRHIVEIAREILNEKEMPEYYWGKSYTCSSLHYEQDAHCCDTWYDA